MCGTDKDYKGPFSIQLKEYIDEKRRLGCKYTAEEEISHKFDEFSMYYDCTNGISRQLADDFTELQPNWKEATQKRRISFMMNFGRYLLNHDIKAALPDKACLHSAYESFKPYIFTHEQVQQLFELADEIHPNYRNSHIFYPVLFRVLYCTGIRLGEALSMTMADVDLEHLTITIRNPKNHRDRRLPIGESLKSYLEWYIKEVHPVYHEEDLFFMTRGKQAYHGGNCNVFFVSLIKKIGIPYGGYKNRGPSIHCLRHTFCVHSLNKMLSDGIPNGVALTLLSNYMGHQSLSATGRYLQLTAEAFPCLTERIESMYGDVFPEVVLPGEGALADYENDN